VVSYHAVRKVFLLGIAAHIGEGQNRDRRLIGERQWLRQGRWGFPPRNVTVVDPVDADGPGNVLYLVLAEVLKVEGQPVADVIMNCVGDKHPARLGEGFETCGHVHPIPEDVVAFGSVGVRDHCLRTFLTCTPTG